mmetsp:Transcript_13158/g.28467  ORF Transcript_13158/g.28467 Transcript_13158/m.28467 type:complete len:235 (-) Transcript_13158:251-955(-)|eukprot:CAMPEP_0172526882 /NCGR_PEP_ID=MMETSP1067-20121228/1704_1 /TAXON_ID=265564 ORGANISM="Thalassiosira punctigera, Strain Tpunct2005C2" /NCGR_SAMPLE_ID=MMETSP1067 /ASSEMBLY_ACC=CAM_ASM_000444 /LENGTH=234 /DNA_ID=CAMNT_0013310495 /DNA_START=104 /DNA_END=808 /DNA_ORIENTATION=-
MKLLAAGLGTLLFAAAGAFRPIGGRSTGSRILRIDPGRIFSPATALGSYLDDLSGISGPPARWSSTASASVSASSATQMNLEVADALANGVVAAAKRNNFAPIVVTVLDKSANAIVQKRMDGDVHAAYPEFSYAKAYTCVSLHVSSREFRDKYTRENDAAKIAQLNSMMAVTGKMAAFPGGILLRNEEDEVIGAIGVSGAAGDEDEYAALRGTWDSGLGLRTRPTEHSCATALD